MSIISMKQLLEAGVHFGHQTRRWNPRMSPYIFTQRKLDRLTFISYNMANVYQRDGDHIWQRENTGKKLQEIDQKGVPLRMVTKKLLKSALIGAAVYARGGAAGDGDHKSGQR